MTAKQIKSATRDALRRRHNELDRETLLATQAMEIAIRRNDLDRQEEIAFLAASIAAEMTLVRDELRRRPIPLENP